MLFKYLSVLFFTSSLLLPLVGRLEASCGLHVCPIPVPVGSGANQLSADSQRQVFPSQVWLEPMFTSFDIGGKGSYLQTNLVGVYEHRLFRAGGALPFVYLNAPSGEKTVGLANLLPYGEFYLLNNSDLKVSLGSQFEIPIADHDKGLGGGHFMAMPYVNFWKVMGDLRFATQLGFMQALSGHSHGTTSLTYVNPHSNSEVAARAMVSYTFAGAYTAELNSGLRQVVDHDSVGDKTFLDIGTAARAQLGPSLALRGGVNIPVTSTQRYLFQAYLGLYYYF